MATEFNELCRTTVSKSEIYKTIVKNYEEIEKIESETENLKTKKTTGR